MAIKTCKDCGKEVSTTAKNCPHCGRPNPSKSTTLGCGTVLLTFIGLFVFVCFIYNLSNQKTYTASASVANTSPITTTTKKNVLDNCDIKISKKFLNSIAEFARSSNKNEAVYYSWGETWHTMTLPEKENMVKGICISFACIQHAPIPIIHHYKGKKVAECDSQYYCTVTE